jgi:superfamily II DNA/RNA helicase
LCVGVQIISVGTTLNLATAEITDRFLLNPVWIIPPFQKYSYSNVLAPKVKYFSLKLASDEQQLQLLCDLYDIMSMTGQTIIYCNSKRKVDYLTQKMRDRDFTVSSVVSSSCRNVYIN